MIMALTTSILTDVGRACTKDKHVIVAWKQLSMVEVIKKPK